MSSRFCGALLAQHVLEEVLAGAVRGAHERPARHVREAHAQRHALPLGELGGRDVLAHLRANAQLRQSSSREAI